MKVVRICCGAHGGHGRHFSLLRHRLYVQCLLVRCRCGQVESIQYAHSSDLVTQTAQYATPPGSGIHAPRLHCVIQNWVASPRAPVCARVRMWRRGTVPLQFIFLPSNVVLRRQVPAAKKASLSMEVDGFYTLQAFHHQAVPQPSFPTAFRPSAARVVNSSQAKQVYCSALYLRCSPNARGLDWIHGRIIPKTPLNCCAQNDVPHTAARECANRVW